MLRCAFPAFLCFVFLRASLLKIASRTGVPFFLFFVPRAMGEAGDFLALSPEGLSPIQPHPASWLGYTVAQPIPADIEAMQAGARCFVTFPVALA